MTDIPPTATELPAGGFSYVRAIFSLAFSIFINAICPYLIYRTLEPQYPAGSLMPLLASTVFPLMGLLIGFARRRADIIAIISLVEILISIAVTLVASNVTYALIARGLQGTLTGVFFLVTVTVRRPLLWYVALQFVAASSPAIVAGFEKANAWDKGRTFSRLTVLWGLGTIAVSVGNVWLAQHVPPAQYLLVAPILSIGTNVLLIGVTMRYASRRLGRYRGQVG